MRKILKSIYCFIFGCKKVIQPIQYTNPDVEYLDGLEKKYLDVINHYRTNKVTSERFLKILAFQHSLDMSTSGDASHYGWDERVEKIKNHFGNVSAAEIIAYNFSTPSSTLNAWLKSPGHKAILDDGKYNYVGIGLYKKEQEEKMYVTVIFAKL
jgi:uncharacterized protein YkwD